MEYIFLGIGMVAGAVIASIITLLVKKNSVIALQTRIGELKNQVDSAASELSVRIAELNDINIKSARLESDKAALNDKISEFRKEQMKNQELLQTQFENLANKIFEKKTDRFKTESEKSIKELINPLKEQLGTFQKKIDDSFGEQAKEQRSLKDQIVNIVQVSEKMRSETEGLTRALKGDVKAQGNWGEIILEKILEESGLRKDRDYTLQGIDMGLKSEDGQTQRPDVTVNLPENKHIIIDSKVSLVHYERYCREEDDLEKAKLLNLFLNSIREHAKGLESKHYQKNSKINSPDFVMMFMPVEGAYSLAIQKDEGLHKFAWDRKIVIVCPTTLFATLSTIASLWKIENQNKNAHEIARQAGSLHDKFVGFLEDMNDISKHINNADKAYNNAFKKLSEGKDNLVSKVEKLKDLGAKAGKSIPQNFSGTDEKTEIPELKLINN